MTNEPFSRKLFSDLLHASQIVEAKEELLAYGRDLSPEYQAPDPSLILFPRSHDEVLSIVRRAREKKISLVPSGGRTGYSGGAFAGNKEVVVSLSKMRKVFSVDSVARVIHCEAGLTTQALQDTAAAHDLFYPVDFASKGSSSIGGNIATNAGGIRVIKHGSTRDWILGLRFVSGAGEEFLIHRDLFKNQSGLDFRSLIIGSEGILGFVTEAYIKLRSKAAPRTTALATIKDSNTALEILAELRKDIELELFEYFDRNCLEVVLKARSKKDPFNKESAAYLLIETSESNRNIFEAKLAHLINSRLIDDVVIAESTQQQRELLAFREEISESTLNLFAVHKNDISVSISKLGLFVNKLKQLVDNFDPNLYLCIFGHFGDGNLHLNYCAPKEVAQTFYKKCPELDNLVFDLVLAEGGSISAEHGVGLLKRDYLAKAKSKAEIQLMRDVKAVFDPDAIINPGKLLA